MATARKTSWGRFEEIPEEIPHRLVWRSWGLDKVGKNHFGFTAPGPILGQYFDPGGIEGVAQKFKKAPLGPKEIRAIQYRFHKRTNDQEYAQELRDRFIEDFYQALDLARTIQWDETETWELFRFAEFGRESDLPREYGPLNAQYRGFLQAAYDRGINMQLIQKVKEVWKNDKPTGIYAPFGFKQGGNLVQVNLEHTWDAEHGFQVKIVNCRQNTALWGETFPDLTFTDLGQLVYPETEEEDWQ